MSRHQLVHRETVGPSNEPLYELGRVGAAPAGNGHLHTHRRASYTSGDEMVRKSFLTHS